MKEQLKNLLLGRPIDLTMSCRVKVAFAVFCACCFGYSGWAFSLLGPIGNDGDAWQTTEIGYGLTLNEDDIGAPKNLGEEYRRNTPVVYYAFDANFLDYFGSNGVAAVEQAIAVFNNLTNVSQYSKDLSEFPLSTQRVNYQAEALSLVDIKSITMTTLLEQLGLAEPERWVWCLHDRLHSGTIGCPVGMSYNVIERNFDPVTSEPSLYVNNTLYSYYILEFCGQTGPPPPPLADAAEFAVDPLAFAFTSVAGTGDYWDPTGLHVGTFTPGRFYSGLTRDDVGGLRYLLRTNNINFETSGTNVETFVTNAAFQLLYTSNLNTFAEAALTNTDAQLAGLYPNLVYTEAATPIFTNVGFPNIVAYFTNRPGSPVGSIPELVIATNDYTTNVVTLYEHHFANVVTNTYYTNRTTYLLITNIAPDPHAPVGSPSVTNITFEGPINETGAFGDFYIIPPNLCGYNIVRTQLTSVTLTTNLVLYPTNIVDVLATNVAGGITNVSQVSESVVAYFTNHVFVVNEVTCPTNTVALRQGIERIKFVRVNYDSYIGQDFEPITNTYTMMSVTNNTLTPQTMRRVVRIPDFIFTAADLYDAPGNETISGGAMARPTNTWNTSILAAPYFAYSGLAGPGTIEPPTFIAYNKGGPAYLNFSPVAYSRFQAQANQRSYVSFRVLRRIDESSDCISRRYEH